MRKDHVRKALKEMMPSFSGKTVQMDELVAEVKERTRELDGRWRVQKYTVLALLHDYPHGTVKRRVNGVGTVSYRFD